MLVLLWENKIPTLHFVNIHFIKYLERTDKVLVYITTKIKTNEYKLIEHITILPHYMTFKKALI